MTEEVFTAMFSAHFPAHDYLDLVRLPLVTPADLLRLKARLESLPESKAHEFADFMWQATREVIALLPHTRITSTLN
jgi:hypothetical protein